MTLKTGVMILKIQLCFTGINCILKYIKTENYGVVVEKNWGGRKKYFWNVLRSIEKLCVPSQNFCILSQRYFRSLAKLLHSLAKLLRSLAKIFAFYRKTNWVRTNSSCLLYSLRWFIQLRMFTMERFLTFYFELGLMYKEIQSVVSSRHGFGTF